MWIKGQNNHGGGTMDLQGALKETPSTGIMVGRRQTSLRKSESMYSFRK